MNRPYVLFITRSLISSFKTKLKVLSEAISILLGVLIAPIYNLNVPPIGFKLGYSSRLTISGVTALNYDIYGRKKWMYFFIKYLFFFDKDHLCSAGRRAMTYIKLGESVG